MYIKVALIISTYGMFNYRNKILDRYYRDYYSQREIVMREAGGEKLTQEYKQRIYERNEKYVSENGKFIFNVIKLISEFMLKIKKVKRGLIGGTSFPDRKTPPKRSKEDHE